MSAEAIIIGAQIVAGHDGSAELLVNLRHPNGAESPVVLDEATAALDPETEASICEGVRGLAREHNITVLAISHQPAWAHVADQVRELQPLTKAPVSAG